MIADGCTFAAVAIATFFVRTPTGSLSRQLDDDNPGGVRAGWRGIRGQRPLVGYLGVQTLASLTFAMFPVLFIAFVIDVLKGNEATVGVIRGMAAFGGLVAAALVGRAARDIDPSRLMLWGNTGLGAVAFFFVNISNVSSELWIFLVVSSLSGLPNMTSQIGAVGAAQRLCPAPLLGRFQGVNAATTAVGSIVGSVLVGVLIDSVGVRTLLNVQATLYVLCGVATYTMVIRHTHQFEPAGR